MSLDAGASELREVAARMRAELDVRDRTYLLKRYEHTFLGSDAVAWMRDRNIVQSTRDALAMGNVMLELGFFRHVTRDHAFKNEPLFYRFAQDERSHGEAAAVGESGQASSWADLTALSVAEVGEGGSCHPDLGLVPHADRTASTAAAGPDGDSRVGAAPSAAAAPLTPQMCVSPLDRHNVALLDHVHPARWVAPTPEGRYDLLVIGAGAGGLVSAAGAAGVGARVAIVEEYLMGGDCLNVGCVPSKALIRCARAANDMRRGAEFGLECGDVRVKFDRVMERMRAVRAHIARNDSARRFSKDLGVDVFLGRARFTSPSTAVVNGQTLTFNKAVIATGGRPRVPDIPGIHSVPYITNASVFNLTELPGRLVVVGGGPIGLELAQTFARFGSKVTVLVRSAALLPREDPEAARLVRRQLEQDGVELVFNAAIQRVSELGARGSLATSPTTPTGLRPAAAPPGSDGGDGLHDSEAKLGEQVDEAGRREHHGHPRASDARRIHIWVTVAGADSEQGPHHVELEAEALLLAAGRVPNVQDLGLEDAGVRFDLQRGVHVNDALRTSNPRIFAVGDVCTEFKFTHVADFMARIVIRNALFFGRGAFSKLLIPWATFTDPEVAHVGLYERDLAARGIAYDVYTRSFEDVDRAIVESATSGFVKVLCKRGSDAILGATIVGEHAGDMISEFSVAMSGNIGLGKIAAVIHPYPTFSEALRQVGDMYNKTRLTPVTRSLLRNVVRLQR